MNNIVTFISLSKREQQFLIALFLIIIAFIALVGLIGHVIKKLMASQGRRVDEMMSQLVEHHIVTDHRHYWSVAMNKSHRLLLIQMTWPLLIIGVNILWYWLLIHFTGDNGLFIDMFNYQTRGFNTILFVFDWANTPKSIFFGMSLVSGWPPLLNTPHFVLEAWPNYIFVTISLIGLIWLVFSNLAFISRTLRIRQTHRSIFIKPLESLNK
jgi:hypothetical protein